MFFRIFISILFLSVSNIQAQSSFLAEKDIAVFYPKDFDSVQTLPSLAIIHPLKRKMNLPTDWKTIPIFKTINGKNSIEIQYEKSTDLYGTGEVTGSLRRNGKEITLWNTDNGNYLQYNGDRLYQSHPWILGVREDGTSFGIIADHTWKQEIKLDHPIQMISEGPSFRVIIIEKDSPQEVLKSLAKLTGTIDLPPLWALGYQQSRFSYYPQKQAASIVDEFREREIPLDVLWMDINYMDGFRIFTFDPKGYPDPKKLNDYLHQNNVRSVFMIDPGVKKEEGYFVYDQGTKGNHWTLAENNQAFTGKVWPGQCVFPDYTREETQNWWASLYKDFMSLGIDGVWNDMNEPSVFDGTNGSMPATNMHRGSKKLPAGNHLRYHNVYGMLMVKATREGILNANPNKRPFVLSRSNFMGGQRYAATWTGDNKSTFNYLKESIPMSINLSLSGQPFNGPDIGGFSGDANPELFGQWIALGAYYPFSRNHTSTETVAQEPWAFGKEIENVSRTAINRRYQLLPYLYTLFREASITGMPIMRPIFFADIKDNTLRAEEQAFLLGENLMIIPRWAKNVHEPKGNWQEIKFENKDDGYQSIIKLKPGGIVPISQVVQSTEDYSANRITLLVNLDEEGYAKGDLYDDEKDGFSYREGNFSYFKYEADLINDTQLKVSVKQIEGNRNIEQYYRIGWVKEGEIHYSNWSSSKNIQLKL
ncbi:MAG TPA: alpha-glucosidase [Mesonia sp.]|nr:alpha-glucosidase [Mesonia sp.]HIO27862.1 alpha-glucosidase [Flavobacteriaceae bacterium]